MKLKLIRGEARSGFAHLNKAPVGVSDAQADLAKAIEEFDRQAEHWKVGLPRPS